MIVDGRSITMAQSLEQFLVDKSKPLFFNTQTGQVYFGRWNLARRFSVAAIPTTKVAGAFVSLKISKKIGEFGRESRTVQ